MRKYFGTDGIRGEANRELTAELAMKLGYALGYQIRKKNPDKKNPKVIMGCDTRISGYMLRSALTAGLNSMGVSIDFIGVVPTPGVAYLTIKKQAAAGIMISASHNPAKDNGIKIFAGNGHKLPDEAELELERLIDNCEEIFADVLAGDQVGKFKYAEDEYYQYRDHLLSTVAGDFAGMKIILDAANGSAYRIAKEVFMALKAEVVVINDTPNGKNINVKCGSTHPEILSKVVVGYEADLGLAYDGDADRLIAVDRHGKVVDGDKIIAILAVEMKKKGILNDNKVVTTIMSNMGFESFLNENNIGLIRANVGDRYVLEKMRNHGLNLGGEQSGHILLLDYSTTGDGVLTSLKLVEALRDSKTHLGERSAEVIDWPQEMINVRVARDKKATWAENGVITSFITEKEVEMKGTGRVLVRTSGTEPIIRVMVEGKHGEMVHRIVKEIADLVKKELAE
ncbi:MAG: phosphoglucosamine mutase [Fusobacteriaceae bacterium]